MAKPYGKFPKRVGKSPRKKSTDAGGAVRYRLREKDDAPLTMERAQQGFYQLTKDMLQLAHFRAARIDVYVRYIDEDGQPASVGKDEISIYPYRSAADEHGA